MINYKKTNIKKVNKKIVISKTRHNPNSAKLAARNTASHYVDTSKELEQPH